MGDICRRGKVGLPGVYPAGLSSLELDRLWEKCEESSQNYKAKDETWSLLSRSSIKRIGSLLRARMALG